MANINTEEPVLDADYIESESIVKTTKKKKRPTRLMVATGLVGAGAIAWVLMGGGTQEIETAVAPPPPIDTTAGGSVQANSEQYAESLRSANEKRSQNAIETGGTFIAAPEGVLKPIEKTEETIPVVVAEPAPPAEEKTTAVVTRKRAVVPQLQKVSEPEPQQAAQAQQKQQDKPPENPYIGMISGQMKSISTAMIPAAPTTGTLTEERAEGAQTGNGANMTGESGVSSGTLSGSQDTSSQLAQSGETLSDPAVVGSNGQPVDPFSEEMSGPSAIGETIAEGGQVNQNVTDSAERQQEKIYVRAGDIMYGEVVATVHSDMPLPVIAEVTTGEHKGARLKGTFTTDAMSGKLMVNFSQMTKNDVTVPVSALAIDGYNADTTVRSGIERRYLKRYGTIFASTFITGLSEGLAEPEKIVITNEDGDEEVVEKKRTTEESAWNGVNAALGTISGDIMATAPKGPKVYLHSGYPVGILFMEDLRENPDAETLDAQ